MTPCAKHIGWVVTVYYHGLVPKLIALSPGEQLLLRAMAWSAFPGCLVAQA